jgi:hypothetical protein
MDLGYYSTKEEAIRGGIDSLGEGGGDFVILEALELSVPVLDADRVIDEYFEWLGDCSDYYSGEGDGPEWDLGKEEQKAATAELQEALTTWSVKWLIPNVNRPDIFAATRNLEAIKNSAPAEDQPA